jgi:hypothetical protein
MTSVWKIPVNDRRCQAIVKKKRRSPTPADDELRCRRFARFDGFCLRHKLSDDREIIHWPIIAKMWPRRDRMLK